MPYKAISELPPAVKDNLSPTAQHIYMAAFNSAAGSGHADPACAQIAWGAVKNAGYSKNQDGEWVKEAVWDSGYINDLPDSAFAAIESGGKKVDGKTEPRSLRHLPYKGADGKVDLPHLRNALARLDQTQLSSALKAEARTKLEAAAKHAGVGDSGPAKESVIEDPEAELTFRQISESLDFSAPQPTDKTGSVWDVRVLSFGTSKNGYLWTREAGQQLIGLLDSAPVGLYMNKAGESGHASEESVMLADGPIIRNIVADLQNPRLEADGVYASLHVHEDAGWLKQKLLGLANRGVVDKVLGLSVDTLAGMVPVQLREGAAKLIKEVKRLLSVDIVTRPSADGRFIRATAGPLLTEEAHLMNREQLIAMIKEQRPKLLEGRVVEELTDAQLTALVKEALKEPEPPKKDPEADDKLKKLTALEQRLAVRESHERVAEAVDATELPAPVKAKIKKSFAGRVVEQAEIDLAVKEEIETWGKLADSGQVKDLGKGKAEVNAEPRDKIQAGLDMLFGVTRESVAKKLEGDTFSPAAVARIMESFKSTDEAAKDPGLKFRGIRDFYQQITGDTDVTGRMPTRVREGATVVLSSDWAQVLADTLYRRLLTTYATVQYNERSISRYGSVNDFRNRHVVHLGYFGDLPAVAENGLYDGLTNPTDDEVVYAVSKRGGRFAVTLETIKNDDIRSVMETVDRLGRAARRTLAQFIWNFWMSNGIGFPNAGAVFDVDSKTWFDSTSGNNAGLHCNYGTTALTADSTGAAEVMNLIVKLAQFKEKDSAKALGLPPFDQIWLDVPLALYATANLLNRTASFSTTVANPIYQMFGLNNERINANPLFTDTNDWGVHVNPNGASREAIQVDFLDGREEPELFVADLPTQGSLFSNDRIEYKIRHIYGGDLMDVVSAAKNIV
jgi:cation transport regulator ChaB